jgi:hypothetical protein
MEVRGGVCGSWRNAVVDGNKESVQAHRPYGDTTLAADPPRREWRQTEHSWILCRGVDGTDAGADPLTTWRRLRSHRLASCGGPRGHERRGGAP